MHKWEFWKCLLLAELPLSLKRTWKDSYCGIRVPKVSDKHVSSQNSQQLPSSYLIEIKLLLSAVSFQKEAECDAYPLHVAQGSWNEGNEKREAISCVTHQALFSAKCLPVAPHSLSFPLLPWYPLILSHRIAYLLETSWNLNAKLSLFLCCTGTVSLVLSFLRITTSKVKM